MVKSEHGNRCFVFCSFFIFEQGIKNTISENHGEGKREGKDKEGLFLAFMAQCLKKDSACTGRTLQTGSSHRYELIEVLNVNRASGL